MRMATHPLWNDDYWLLVLQLYLKRPTGVKAVYAREAVDLAMELHLPPHSSISSCKRWTVVTAWCYNWSGKLTPRSRVGLQKTLRGCGR